MSKDTGAPKTETVEVLAERLRWKMEHLDPSDERPWKELTDTEKEFFRICVRELLVCQTNLRHGRIYSSPTAA